MENPQRRDYLKLAAAAAGSSILTWTVAEARSDDSDEQNTQLDPQSFDGMDGIHYVPPEDGIRGIQSVIDEHAPNVSIRLGTGEYVGRELTLDHGVHLVGNGRNATRLVLADGANTDLLRTPNPDERTCMQVLLQNITFDGNKDNNSSGDGVYGSFWNGRFVDCDFVTAAGKGFWLAGSSTASTDDNYFRGCRFVASMGDGLQIGLNRDAGPAVGVSRLESCWFGSNQGRGVKIRGNDNIITTSKFYANRDTDVVIDRGDRNQIRQSDLSKQDPTAPCVELIASKGVNSIGNKIDGNVIFGSFRDAIYCNADRNDIVALQIHDNTVLGRTGGPERNRSAIFAEGSAFVACSARNNTLQGDYTASALRIPSSWQTSGNIL
ncbi:Right handed beta helix region [Halogranum rubrum]|uniref:Right handed beta helix region n=2 Tax=Halogranum rubrum TaxID=553466 RepID=A0A1I4IRF8_9EURY|nr:Right handed beta helix region [Halogranum rubrum]